MPDTAIELARLSSAIEARNKLDEGIYPAMERREQRDHKIIWVLILINAALAGVNLAQSGIIPG